MFRSKVDGWLAVVLIGGALAVVGSIVAVVMVREPVHALVLVPIMLIGVVLPVWVLASTDYTLGATELRVRSGPFKWRVPLRAIQTVTATRNPLSSPALSLDRLRIDYGPLKSIMISPAEKDRFLAELERRRR